jgi:DNA-binding MarR family transcriptional regulator
MKNYHLGGLATYFLRAEAAFHTEHLKPYNINYDQFSFLMTLYLEDGVNQGTIAKRMFLNKVTVTRAIDNLEREGYVYRTHDEKDGRANRIFLTPKGRELESIIRQQIQEWDSIIVSGLTEGESLLLKELMKKIVLNAIHEREQEDSILPADLMK